MLWPYIWPFPDVAELNLDKSTAPRLSFFRFDGMTIHVSSNTADRYKTPLGFEFSIAL